VEYWGDFDSIYSSDRLQRPVFHICLASDRGLPTIGLSFFEGLKAYYNTYVKSSRDYIAQLTEEYESKQAEYEATEAELQAALAELEAKKAQVQSKDAELSALNSEFQATENELREKVEAQAAALHEQRRVLADLVASWRYRLGSALTWPVRRLLGGNGPQE